MQFSACCQLGAQRCHERRNVVEEVGEAQREYGRESARWERKVEKIGLEEADARRYFIAMRAVRGGDPSRSAFEHRAG